MQGRKVVFLLTGLLVAIAMLSLLSRGLESRAQVTPVETREVTRRDLVATITASGIVKSAVRGEIRSELDGRVARVNVREGETVFPGQVILELDRAELALEYDRVNADLAAAEADLAHLGSMRADSGQDLEILQAQARLALARTRFEDVSRGPAEVDAVRAESALDQAEMALREAERDAALMKELYEAGAVPRDTMDEAVARFETCRLQYEVAKKEREAIANAPRRADVDAALAQLREAEAGLALAEAQARSREAAERAAEERVAHIKAHLKLLEKQLSATRLKAPVGGILASLIISPGDLASAGALVGEVIDPGRLLVEAAVDEVDAGHIRVGQRVKVSSDACPGQEFDGVVTYVAPCAIPERGVSRFNVRVALDKTHAGPTGGALRPGMSADVEIITARRSGVLAVPAQAVAMRGGRKVVLIAAGGKVKEVPVACGLETLTDIEVAGNLQAGDEVIVGPYEVLETLSDGDAVSVKRDNPRHFIEFKVE
ncbi:MAG TPA: efflux RND transporter periplasmic adaptor subunit [Firmicutes bacterium]|nr:efflux RND transporter periplasmic adaptor subunit [Bacillota bacterium]